MKIGLVCIARDEGRDIAEWLLFHTLIGFDSIMLYNHCSVDDTAEVAKRVQALPFTDIRIIDWPVMPYPQRHAYQHALENFGADFDWVGFIDSDEFFVPIRHRTAHAFFESMNDHAAIAINWLCYGSSGLVDFPTDLVTRSFVRRAPDAYSANRHVKSFVRPGAVETVVGPHQIPLKQGLCYVDSTGAPAPWLKTGKFSAVRGVDIARINHYFTRSRAHYLKKISVPGVGKGRIRIDEFALVDRNEIDDPVVPAQFGDILAKIDFLLNP